MHMIDVQATYTEEVSVIEIDGKEYRTRAQWEKVHRHVSQPSKGIRREWWHKHGATFYQDDAVFYPKSATRKWSAAEVRREKSERKQAELEAMLKRERDEAATEAVMRAMEDATGVAPDDDVDRSIFERPHTAYQWVVAGFVPIDEARWGDGLSADYWYCTAWDVRYDPGRAAELMAGAPREVDRLPDGRRYNGMPWW